MSCLSENLTGWSTSDVLISVEHLAGLFGRRHPNGDKSAKHVRLATRVLSEHSNPDNCAVLTSKQEDSKTQTKLNVEVTSSGHLLYLSQTSTIPQSLSEEWEKEFTSLSIEELLLGKILGRGQFAVVREVLGHPDCLRSASRGGRREENTDMQTEPTDQTARKQFAIKVVTRQDFTSDDDHFKLAVSNLGREGRILAKLQHPHIIQLYGTSSSKSVDGHFLVIERLHQTLAEKIKEWKAFCLTSTHGSWLSHLMKRHEKPTLEEYRLKVAYQLSIALKYIHSRNVIHRDLKPSNVGFDVNGNIKMFDFGLSKDLTDEKKTSNDRYKLTGRTGSIRYMAPEVYHQLPYNKSADMYSVAILLWEVFTLEEAFVMYPDSQSFTSSVYFMGYRPELEGIKSETVKRLLQRAWSNEIEKRITASDVVDAIEKEHFGVGDLTCRCTG